nr:hypothetical protein [Tanacetum cinerariifolium]
TKTTQHNKIANLKRRVKKLEKKNMSRTRKVKRLYNVGLTAKVESSDDEESLDEEITLVNVQDDAEMFDVNALDGKEVFIARKNDNVV